MTKATITKTAKEKGISLDLIKITRRNGTYDFDMVDLPADMVKANLECSDDHNLPEVDKMIRKYNREVKKLLKTLDVEYWGFQGGDGAWHYELGEQSYASKLAFANID